MADLVNKDIFGPGSQSATEEAPLIDGEIEDPGVTEDMLLALKDFKDASKPEDQLEALRFLIDLELSSR